MIIIKGESDQHFEKFRNKSNWSRWNAHSEFARSIIESIFDWNKNEISMPNCNLHNFYFSLLVLNLNRMWYSISPERIEYVCTVSAWNWRFHCKTYNMHDCTTRWMQATFICMHCVWVHNVVAFISNRYKHMRAYVLKEPFTFNLFDLWAVRCCCLFEHFKLSRDTVRFQTQKIQRYLFKS